MKTKACLWCGNPIGAYAQNNLCAQCNEDVQASPIDRTEDDDREPPQSNIEREPFQQKEHKHTKGIRRGKK